MNVIEQIGQKGSEKEKIAEQSRAKNDNPEFTPIYQPGEW